MSTVHSMIAEGVHQFCTSTGLTPNTVYISPKMSIRLTQEVVIPDHLKGSSFRVSMIPTEVGDVRINVDSNLLSDEIHVAVMRRYDEAQLQYKHD